MKTKRPHNDKCRERMYREMNKTEEGKKWLEGAEDRANEYLEKRLKEDHGDRDSKRRKPEANEETTTSVAPAGDTSSTTRQTPSSSSTDPIIPMDDGAPAVASKTRPADSESEHPTKKARAE